MTRKTQPEESTSAITGVRLIDGRPYFADHNGTPMNRQQYLAATEPERRAAAEAKKAELVAELREATDDKENTK